MFQAREHKNLRHNHAQTQPCGCMDTTPLVGTANNAVQIQKSLWPSKCWAATAGFTLKTTCFSILRRIVWQWLGTAAALSPQAAKCQPAGHPPCSPLLPGGVSYTTSCTACLLEQSKLLSVVWVSNHKESCVLTVGFCSFHVQSCILLQRHHVREPTQQHSKRLKAGVGLLKSKLTS